MKAIHIFKTEYEYIEKQVLNTSNYHELGEYLRSDLLRASIVFIVSAFDRFMHDFAIEHFMMILQAGNEIPRRAKNVKVGFNILCTLSGDPKSNTYIEVEDALREHLGWQSFQHAKKVSEILSALFDGDIWEKLSLKLQMNSKDAKNTLDLIIDRRDKIAHEADIRPETIASGIEKYPIDEETVKDAMGFIFKLVDAIDLLS